MTEVELIRDINEEINVSCSLPYELDKEAVKRLIKKARSWMYDNYQYAVESKLVPVPLDLFNTPEFKADRSIKLPDCIVSVFDLRETSTGIFGPNNGDFSDAKLMGAEIFMAPFQSDSLMFRTAMYSYYDLAQAFLLETIAYDWNRNTKKLSILGRKPVKNAVARVMTKIPEDKLYDDEIFRRYCYAEAKIKLGTMLGAFTFNLPGNVQINYDAIKSEGKDEMTDIKAQIDAENSPDWFVLFH